MKKTSNLPIQNPTIEELLKRVQLLEKKNADLEAKLEKEKSNQRPRLIG